jgi:hypothetical protein
MDGTLRGRCVGQRAWILSPLGSAAEIVYRRANTSAHLPRRLCTSSEREFSDETFGLRFVRPMPRAHYLCLGNPPDAVRTLLKWS